MSHEKSVRPLAASGTVASLHNRSGSKGNVLPTPQQARSTRKGGSLRPDDGGFDDPEWNPPQEFDEYRLIRLLGKGSMGRVYLAHDTVLDRPVAVKFVGNALPDAEDRERFLVEARAVARLQHPNVVTIYRVGELEGRPYLITEYVRGKSLSDLAVPVPSRKVLELGIGLARGLAAAHRHGVLHRDIKLANAVLSETGEVKLLDFSLAKLLDPSAADSVQSPPALPEAIDAATSAVQRHAAEENRRIDRFAETIKLRAEDIPDHVTPKPLSSSERIQAAAVSSSSMSAAAISAAGMSLRSSSLTQAGTLLGTPHYMAPELWRAEPATRRSDVYALGVLMYILAAGRPATEANSPVELATRVQEQEPRPLIERAPRCDPRLASIIDRCLRRDPFERYASADDLLAALEALQSTGRELAIPEGNPYRGLQAFESKHRALFFGRAAEIRAVLERLRSEALVVVAGDSGVGKSSLVKAGVVPLVEEGNLDQSRQWASAAMTPGRYPLQTLISTLAALFDMTEETMGSLAGAGGEEFVRALRKQLGDARGRLLVIDQFEELATIGGVEEVAVVGPLLARLASGLPGLRVIATVRGDFLTRVVQVPGIGDDLARAIYILRPLSPEGAREAIVGPARVKGVSFESEALVDELVQAGSKGSLPLLQFALAELWEIRDQAANIISAADLRKIGGVSGALARHGDAALAELIPDQRTAARRVLMRLVTVDDTRAVRTEDELVAGSPAAEAALKALVKSRLVVAREVGDQPVFEIAHEALLGGWATLSVWLEEEREGRAVRYRLEMAVADWERLGRSRDALWSGKPLQEVLALDPTTLRPKEREFIDACRAAATRLKHLRRAAVVLVPALVLATYVGVLIKGRLELQAKVEGHVAAAAEESAAAEKLLAEADALRVEAFAAFDKGEKDRGEELWGRHVAALPEVERAQARASQQLETALSLDGGRDDVRERLADALLQRALLAERSGVGAIVVQDLLERLKLYDPTGARTAAWSSPAELTVDSEPAGARVVLEHYVDDGTGRRKIGRAEELGVTPLPPLRLERGSYRLRFELLGRAPVTYPVALERGESLAIEVPLPSAASVPDGFVYIPPGRFLYGSADPDEVRGFFLAEPLRRVETGAYLIGRNEVTYGDYITFLEALPEEARRELLASTAEGSLQDGVRLREISGGWQLELDQGDRVYTTRSGELLTYEGRTQRAAVDWMRLPVTGISRVEATAYLSWLRRTGRVPGARFCNEYEWERAARGADDRRFATGDRISPSEANFDQTYGRQATAYGPDPVGSYPQVESPFGLYDTVGNAFEMVLSPHDDAAIIARGGAYFYDKSSANAANRNVIYATFRHSTVGMRVCATYAVEP